MDRFARVVFVLALVEAPQLGRSAPAHRMIVVCAPGYPGTTALAQPTMDAFARAAEAAARLSGGSLGAIYHETEQAGLDELAKDESVLALVQLPFLLKHGIDLGLEPRLQVVQESGAVETWSLVARRGRIASPAALAGWEVTGAPGYAPEFVRGPILGDWGRLPDTARITFTASALAALRRAAAGETIAVILDGTQSGALPSLPFGADLEAVTRSKPLPGTLLCTVKDRLRGPEADALLRSLLHLHERPGGAEALKSLRMARFDPADAAAIDGARQAFARARHPAPPGEPR